MDSPSDNPFPPLLYGVVDWKRIGPYAPAIGLPRYSVVIIGRRVSLEVQKALITRHPTPAAAQRFADRMNEAPIRLGATYAPVPE